MKISKKSSTAYNRRVIAAEGDNENDFDMEDRPSHSLMFDDDTDDLQDSVDDLQDFVDDLQDSVDEVIEDDPTIEIDNNISNHYIAECDKCKGVFISAMIESDQAVDSITGVCPLCEKESEQILKWVIRDCSGEDNEKI